MANPSKIITDTYLAKGTIGNLDRLGSVITHFTLVVSPYQHTVSGMVEITQSILDGNYSGQVTGKIYSSGFGTVTKLVGLKGIVHPDSPVILELPFEAYMAIDDSWNGSGGFSFGNVHVDDAPVIPSNE